jgi:hypothetical protein
MEVFVFGAFTQDMCKKRKEKLHEFPTSVG